MDKMEKIVSLAKRRGFVFPSSEIYGGLGSVYDYGPMGVELISNIRRQWWKFMVHGNSNVVGLESQIFMHPQVWKASGHLDGFSDPLIDCKSCKNRFRADHLLESAGVKADEKMDESTLNALFNCAATAAYVVPSCSLKFCNSVASQPVSITSDDKSLGPVAII